MTNTESTAFRLRVLLPLTLALLSLPQMAGAQALSPTESAQELQRQQERQRALRDSQERTPDVRLPTVDVDRNAH